MLVEKERIQTQTMRRLSSRLCRLLLIDNLPIKVLQDPFKKRKYDISESIDFEEKERFRDVERGFCSSGTTCTIRDTGEIASP